MLGQKGSPGASHRATRLSLSVTTNEKPGSSPMNADNHYTTVIYLFDQESAWKILKEGIEQALYRNSDLHVVVFRNQLESQLGMEQTRHLLTKLKHWIAEECKVKRIEYRISEQLGDVSFIESARTLLSEIGADLLILPDKLRAKFL